jgi:hypothetical protein
MPTAEAELGHPQHPQRVIVPEELRVPAGQSPPSPDRLRARLLGWLDHAHGASVLRVQIVSGRSVASRITTGDKGADGIVVVLPEVRADEYDDEG